ncbi:hypothetical protein [Bacillus benzoevorans]
MEGSHPQISIKTMTDDHLESFIRCPYKFYYQYVLQRHSKGLRWRQVVQHIVKRVVRKYYTLPLDARSNLNISNLIDKAWRPISLRWFDSRLQYYMVIAKTSEHLLESLLKGKSETPPFLLYQKLNAYVDELETRIQVTFELAEWSSRTFTIKKFLLQADVEMFRLYYHLLVVFSAKVFEKLPEKIVLITLLDGKEHVFFPKMEDVSSGIQYLLTMKYLLQQHPAEFFQSRTWKDCSHCPFSEKCTEGTAWVIRENKTNAVFLH